MPAARRSRTPAAFPGAPLPALRLLADVPADAAVLVLPTRPAVEGEVAVLLATSPVGVEGLLAREKAKGEAGELVSVPVPGEGPLERVLLVGTGEASPAHLRKAGAAAARRAKAAASLALDLRGLDLDDAQARSLVDGLLLASYGLSRKK